MGPADRTRSIRLDNPNEPWKTVSDVVMGGVSTGRIVPAGAELRFEGCLSLRNNGGFALARRAVSCGFAGSVGVRLLVVGDRRTYQLRLRHSNDFDGVAWRCAFSTNGAPQVVEMNCAEFEPVFRGRVVKGAGGLEPARIRQVGFLIGGRTEGEFSLRISSVELILPNA